MNDYSETLIQQIDTMNLLRPLFQISFHACKQNETLNVVEVVDGFRYFQ
jgi:hypothetical protein